MAVDILERSANNQIATRAWRAMCMQRRRRRRLAANSLPAARHSTRFDSIDARPRQSHRNAEGRPAKGSRRASGSAPCCKAKEQGRQWKGMGCPLPGRLTQQARDGLLQGGKVPQTRGVRSRSSARPQTRHWPHQGHIRHRRPQRHPDPKAPLDPVQALQVPLRCRRQSSDYKGQGCRQDWRHL